MTMCELRGGWDVEVRVFVGSKEKGKKDAITPTSLMKTRFCCIYESVLYYVKKMYHVSYYAVI